MANFPTSLDDSTSIPVESASTPLSTNHVTSHTAVRAAIIALETIVGVTASVVTSTFTYILSEITGGDKAVGKTATQTLSNKTLTSPVINLGSDAEGDTYYRNSSGAFVRLPRGTDNYILKMNGNVPNWEAETVTVDATTTTAGIVELATAAEITAGTATGGDGPLVVTPDQLALSTPVFNGSGLTHLDKVRISTAFETAARFTSTVTNDGSTSFGTTGVALNPGVSPAAGSASITMAVTQTASTLYLGSPVFSCMVYCNTITASNSGSSFFGLGNPTVATSGHTYTVGHAGFKLLKSAGVVSLYATQADGTTETASSALVTVVEGDTLDLIMKINGPSSIDYYYRKNGGSLSSATNLTTNMPSGTSTTLQFSSSNNSNADRFNFLVLGATYER